MKSMEIAVQGEFKKRGRGNPQWVKGQSGNPQGRPKKEVSLLTLLRDELEKVPAEYGGKPNTLTWQQIIAKAWVRATPDSPKLLEMMLDRTEGRVPIPITGKDGGPLIQIQQVNIFLQESVAIFQRINLLADPVERERQYALEMDKLQQTRLLTEGKK